MKVSITFDKNLKQTNKKHWVKEIQTVVDRLNSKPDLQLSPKLTPKPNRTQIVMQSQKQPQLEYPLSKKNSVQKATISESQMLIRELAHMQSFMEERFAGITGSINRLVEKVGHVEKRVAVLEAKQEDRANNDEDFDRQFAQISLKYDKFRRQSQNSQGSKKIMRETAASGFSSFLQYTK